MSESVFLPASNWYFSQCFSISDDGWMIYGVGKSISICKPLEHGILNLNSLAYNSKLISNAHGARVSNIALMPAWRASKLFVSAACDGMVKLWSAESLTSKKAHNEHQLLKEEVIGLSSTNDGTVLSVGSLSHLIVWNVEQNTCRELKILPKNFKASSLKCCHYKDSLAAVGNKSGVIFLFSWSGSGRVLCRLKLHETVIRNLQWAVVCKNSLQEENKSGYQELNDTSTVTDIPTNGSLNGSHLLELSSVECEADDTFNIYEDFEADEFGHKKYQPEDIIITKTKNNKQLDFLEECAALKNDILSLKEDKPSNESVLLTNSDITNNSSNFNKDPNEPESIEERLSRVKISENNLDVDILLSAVDDSGMSSIWTETGKLVCMGGCPSSNRKKSRLSWATLLWVSPNCLILADQSGHIFSTDPTKIKGKKMKWTPVHDYHTKAVFNLATLEIATPFTVDGGVVNKKSVILVSTGKDRKLLFYSLTEMKLIKETNCMPGSLTRASFSRMDPLKLAIACGDGSIICWNFEILNDESTKWGNSVILWQGIQNKVLSVCWHPYKENVLAFSTYEGKVALINTSNTTLNAVTQLHPAFTRSVYEVSWSPEGDLLYACGGGSLKVYNTLYPRKEPTLIEVQFEENLLRINTFYIGDKHIITGNFGGSFTVITLEKPHIVEAISYVSTKEIYYIEIHPKAVTNEDGVSSYADWFAVGAFENKFTVLKVNFEDKIRIEVICTLGTNSSINRLAWSPHHNARLLTACSDFTIHVWDILSSSVISTFFGHSDAAMLGVWSPLPDYSHLILSGGTDMTLNVWDTRKHPPNTNICPKRNQKKKTKLATHTETKTSTKKRPDNPKNEIIINDECNLAVSNKDLPIARKKFLSITQNQQNRAKIEGCKRLLRRHMMSQPDFDGSKCDELDINEDEPCMDYLKIFGNRDEVLELLDLEQKSNLEHGRFEAHLVLRFIKGEADEALKCAKERGKLDFFLLSLAPSISHRFWKDLITDCKSVKELKNINTSSYGGILVQKALLRLAVQDVKGAIQSLVEAKMYNEAIVLARIRYLDELADTIFLTWADISSVSGPRTKSAEIYLYLGHLNKALDQLRRANKDEYIEFMYHLAKYSGSEELANIFQNKIALIKQSVTDSLEEENVTTEPDISIITDAN